MKNLLRNTLLLSLAATLRLSAQSDHGFSPDKNTRSIAITATESVTHEADVASLHIGYQLYGSDKDAAYAAGSAASNAILDALHRASVPNDAIESQSQSLAATQPYQFDKLSPAERAARAFQIEQGWTVRCNAADAAKLLDLAVKAGANQSGQIDWSLRDPNAAQAEAAAKALQRARAQAAAMASGLNVKLGALLYASNEVQAEPVRPLMAPMRVEALAKAPPPPPPLAISARQIETSATVYAVFAIE
jgi:uncharacterized protein YggE